MSGCCLTVQNYSNHQLELLPWLGKEKKKSLDLIVIHALISLQVKAHPSVAAHMLLDLEDVKKTSSTEPTLLLIDIAGYALHCCLLHKMLCFIRTNPLIPFCSRNLLSKTSWQLFVFSLVFFFLTLMVLHTDTTKHTDTG